MRQARGRPGQHPRPEGAESLAALEACGFGVIQSESLAQMEGCSANAPPQGTRCAAVKGQHDRQAQLGSTSQAGPGASQASGNPKKTLFMGVSGNVQEQTTHVCVHTCACTRT